MYDWQFLSQLQWRLPYFILDREAALCNALRSNRVPVRAVRRQEWTRGDVRLEGYFNLQSRIDVFQDTIALPSDVAGAFGVEFICARVDKTRLEKWIHENEAPVGGAGERRRGRPHVCDWDVVKREVFRLMDHHGDFISGDRAWNAQARLEKELTDFIEKHFGIEVGLSTLRGRIALMLADWRVCETAGK